MIRKLLTALLCLLLCGCAQQMPAEEATLPADAAETTISAEEAAVLDQAAHDLEDTYDGLLQAYPLHIRKVQGMRATENGLLLFSGYGSTTLTLLSGDNLSVAASVTLDFALKQDDPSFQVCGSGFSFFDPVTRDMVILDSTLQELRRIAVPEDLVGSPVLSSDGNQLYYCTSNAIRVWNLNTDIRRRIKELAYDDQTLTGLHLNDTVIQCRIQDGDAVRALFLDADTGKLLQELDGDISLVTEGQRYYAVFPSGAIRALVFGEKDEEPRQLFPEDLTAEGVFLPDKHAALTVSQLSDDKIQLDYYELDTGAQRAALSLEALHDPNSIVSGSGEAVYLLVYDPEHDCNVILRWDISKAAAGSSEAVYTDTYYNAATPDHAGISACQAYAKELSAKYGIEILIWKDAAAVQPWDYDFEAEYLSRVIMEKLTLLDQCLSQYPKEILTDTASHFGSLKICLVRQITGSAASGSLDAATGIQFFEGSDAYVVLAAGEYAQQALYHELFHVMETHILTNSIALDQWNELNPAGFNYDYLYAANSQRNAGVYLENEHRAFVDTYSMSFPKEDRARIMEYAMLPGNAWLFQTEIMQSKLKALCQGIREAYSLKNAEESFLWEQYLE